MGSMEIPPIHGASPPGNPPPPSQETKTKKKEKEVVKKPAETPTQPEPAAPPEEPETLPAPSSTDIDGELRLRDTLKENERAKGEAHYGKKKPDKKNDEPSA
ncbi:hypothetical protein EXS70_01215 [Candidatus Peribacteria bacterium]|nr:hypothetical protein [Candidatus Peribacteria bacterium]